MRPRASPMRSTWRRPSKPGIDCAPSSASRVSARRRRSSEWSSASSPSWLDDRVWVHQGSPAARGLPQPRVALLPQLILRGPDGAPEAAIDSTPLIRPLEGLYAARAVIPPDPVMAFVDALLEDYADEWLTKAMFHYRWAIATDASFASSLPPGG